MQREPAAGRAQRRFAAARGKQALRWKEFMLLRRDPWLVSQSLMQLLYLVPPALMLWRSFSDSSAAIILITPVIVMAAGQLAGGLAWLTISGEDAADLVATAPIPPSRVTRAKIEVVLIAIGGDLRAAGGGTGLCLAVAGGRHRDVRHHRDGLRRRDPALVPRAGQAQPVPPPPDLVAAWRPSPKPSARSAGPPPPRSRISVPVVALISGAMTAAILAATWKISPQRA